MYLCNIDLLIWIDLFISYVLFLVWRIMEKPQRRDPSNIQAVCLSRLQPKWSRKSIAFYFCSWTAKIQILCFYTFVKQTIFIATMVSATTPVLVNENMGYIYKYIWHKRFCRIKNIAITFVHIILRQCVGFAWFC